MRVPGLTDITVTATLNSFSFSLSNPSKDVENLYTASYIRLGNFPGRQTKVLSINNNYL